MITRLSKTINHYLLGISLIALIYLLSLEINRLGVGLSQAFGFIADNTVMIFILTLTPIISIGVVIERVSMRIVKLILKVRFVGNLFPRIVRNWDEASKENRRNVGVFYASAPQHTFSWHTDHFIRGTFTISWTPLWLTSIPLIIHVRHLIHIGDLYLWLIIIFQVGSSFVLFFYGLHQIDYCYRVVEEVADEIRKLSTAQIQQTTKEKPA